MLHVIDAYPNISRFEYGMSWRILDALTVDPDFTAIANRFNILLARSDHAYTPLASTCYEYSELAGFLTLNKTAFN